MTIYAELLDFVQELEDEHEQVYDDYELDEDEMELSEYESSWDVEYDDELTKAEDPYNPGSYLTQQIPYLIDPEDEEESEDWDDVEDWDGVNAPELFCGEEDIPFYWLPDTSLESILFPIREDTYVYHHYDHHIELFKEESTALYGQVVDEAPYPGFVEHHDIPYARHFDTAPVRQSLVWFDSNSVTTSFYDELEVDVRQMEDLVVSLKQLQAGLFPEYPVIWDKKAQTYLVYNYATHAWTPVTNAIKAIAYRLDLFWKFQKYNPWGYFVKNVAYFTISSKPTYTYFFYTKLCSYTWFKKCEAFFYNSWLPFWKKLRRMADIFSWDYLGQLDKFSHRLEDIFYRYGSHPDARGSWEGMCSYR